MRERVLAGFFGVIEGIQQFATVERNPGDWAAERPTLPAVGTFDGSERTVDQNNRDMLVISSVQIEIRARMPTKAELLTELNEFLGLIIQALADNQELGGYAQRVRYVGCDEPVPVDLTASPIEGWFQADFEIERFEQHATPYA